jgi:hypothetical protein
VGLRQEPVEYRDRDAELSGLLIWDDSGGVDRPGMLVVRGGAGLDDQATERAREFAELGAITFGCDRYGKDVIGHRDRVMCRIPGRIPPRRRGWMGSGPPSAALT